MGSSRTRIRATIDFEADGVQTGFLELPNSTNESAYGWIPIPIVSIRNGAGPRVLLVAGIHGDEYEGQIALTKLTRELTPESVTGQVLILTAANLPAAASGKRVSPMDGGNLNRCFPGNPTGTATEMIADYIENSLLPNVDLVVDLHSGGYSLTYLPCVVVRRKPDALDTNRLLDAARAFGASIVYITDGGQGGADRTLAAAAERQGVPAITAELGGGASVSRQGLRLAEQGTKRMLHFFGALRETPGMSSEGSCRLMEVNGRDYFVYATEQGVFEPRFALGECVERGQVAGFIHDPGTPWKPPEQVRFSVSGTIICMRAPALTKRGDCLYQLATPSDRT